MVAGRRLAGGQLCACGGVAALVVAAGLDGSGDQRASVGERAWVAAQRDRQVDRPVALVWVIGQAIHQVVRGFASAERRHRHDLRPGLAGHGVGVGSGDQDPAR